MVLLTDENGFQIDVGLAGLPIEEEMIERAVSFNVGSRRMLKVVAPNDLIAMKVFANRDRDWVDIADLVTRQGSNVDWPHIEKCTKHLCMLSDKYDALEKLMAFQKKCKRKGPEENRNTSWRIISLVFHTFPVMSELMPTPTIYTLPLGYRAKFPPRCICCEETPDSTIKIAQNSNNPFLSFLFPIIDFFNWSRVEIPICQGCKFRFRLQRYTRELLLIVCVVAAIFLVMPYFNDWTGFGKKVAVAGFVLLLVIPYFLFEFIFPRYFDTIAWGKTVNYEFASKDYAYEFFDLNEDKIIG